MVKENEAKDAIRQVYEANEMERGMPALYHGYCSSK